MALQAEGLVLLPLGLEHAGQPQRSRRLGPAEGTRCGAQLASVFPSVKWGWMLENQGRLCVARE